MKASLPPLDAAAFLDAAVQEGMLVAATAKDLRGKFKDAKVGVARYCVDAGQLTPIQAEALTGLLRPDSIADGYQINGLLGYGGIGVVYQARQPALDRSVALKTIGADRLGTSSAGARFQQEARAIAKLKHPNIVTAYDYGRCTADSEDDRFFLAMEMVDGVDLDHYIRKRGTLDERESWLIVQQVAAALAHANQSGIVHRDIKPANLLLTAPPAGYPLPAGVLLVKVTDFGLVQFGAGAANDQSTRLTVSGATIGTPNYMPPEQIDDAQVDHRADIYALGATAYHMLTGRPPYAGQSLIKVITSKLIGDQEPIDSLPDELTLPTRSLLEEMMCHDPKGRPQDYQTLLDRLANVLEGEGLDSRMTLATGRTNDFINTPSVHNADTVLSEEDSTKPRISRRRLLLGGAAIVVMAVVGGILTTGPQEILQPKWEGANNFRPLKREFLTYWSGGDWRQENDDADSPLYQATPIVNEIHCRLGRTEEWKDLNSPEHFGIALSLFRATAKSMEVSLQWEGKPMESVTIVVDAEKCQLVRKRANQVVGMSPAVSVATSPEILFEYKLQRDEDHWFAYRDELANPIGSLAIKNKTSPTRILIKSIGGEVFLSEARIFALQPITP